MNKLNKNWLEWIVFGASLLLVAGTLGYLIYTAATLGDTPPRVEATTGTIELAAQSFLVPVTVTNQGDQPAAGVHVAVILERDGAEVERSEFDIPFLPRHSRREGWVTFATDPRTAQIRPRILGYEKP